MLKFQTAFLPCLAEASLSVVVEEGGQPGLSSDLERKTFFLLIHCVLSLLCIKLRLYFFFGNFEESELCCTSTRDLIKDAPLIDRREEKEK